MRTTATLVTPSFYLIYFLQPHYAFSDISQLFSRKVKQLAEIYSAYNLQGWYMKCRLIQKSGLLYLLYCMVSHFMLNYTF